MKTRIERCFANLAEIKQKGFVAYVTAGDPDFKTTVDFVLALDKAGVDVVEMGVPFSDPLADGRVIQQASDRALQAGATPEGVFAAVRSIREKSEIPIVLFSYLNPLLAGGFEKNMKKAAAAGVDGLLLLDAPLEEAAPFRTTVHALGMDYISLVAPTSPDERIRKIAAGGTGFLYCISREGVTGAQSRLSAGAAGLMKRVRACTQLPIALGFGISTPEQAAAAAALADAVVVGSAIVDRLNKDQRAGKDVTVTARWVRKMVQAVKAMA